MSIIIATKAAALDPTRPMSERVILSHGTRTTVHIESCVRNIIGRMPGDGGVAIIGENMLARFMYHLLEPEKVDTMLFEDWENPSELLRVAALVNGAIFAGAPYIVVVSAV